MSRSGLLLVACGAGLWLATPAAAQLASPLGGYGAGYRPNAPFNPSPAYGPGYQTPLSPYLNLLRGGDPSANYFLGVLPEQQRRTNARTFGTAIGGLQQQQRLDEARQQAAGPDADLFTPLPTTGHPAAFQNLGGYYPQTGNFRRTGQTQPAQPLRRR